ncbi:hypothetical protein GCM10017566_57280 [Amycolatopsis bartoniae]|uniref:Uncharacterized protein n=1 Tax=Amycolatopsis bartoniae TaxID=941986 RepID=A0A8H9IY06_9PSEU|nr:hypothetical protein GCM10017566_57280 [Amycolatopsis bartoniae]
MGYIGALLAVFVALVRDLAIPHGDETRSCAFRGTTPLARALRGPLVRRLSRAAPVRFYWGVSPFFRKLPGDGRIDACYWKG